MSVYLAGMSETPPRPTPSARPEEDTDLASSHAQQETIERFGPLVMRRTRKDDGRALIYYSDLTGPR